MPERLAPYVRYVSSKCASDMNAVRFEHMSMKCEAMHASCVSETGKGKARETEMISA